MKNKKEIFFLPTSARLFVDFFGFYSLSCNWSFIVLFNFLQILLSSSSITISIVVANYDTNSAVSEPDELRLYVLECCKSNYSKGKQKFLN